MDDRIASAARTELILQMRNNLHYLLVEEVAKKLLGGEAYNRIVDAVCDELRESIIHTGIALDDEGCLGFLRDLAKDHGIDTRERTNAHVKILEKIRQEFKADH